MPVVKKTFRLSEETAAELGKITELENITATEAIRRAICAYGISHAEGHTLPYNDGKHDAAIEALISQLAVKDGQIESLQERLGQTTSALLAAQESIKAAQLLHAADKKEELLPEATADEDKDKTTKKRWWHFWKEDTK